MSIIYIVTGGVGLALAAPFAVGAGGYAFKGNAVNANKH